MTREEKIPLIGLAVLAVIVGIGVAVVLATRNDVTPPAPPGSVPEMAPLPQDPITAPPCSATSPQGVTYDPCVTGPPNFTAAFWNPLNALPYFTKYKTANPNEWATLNAYLRNGQPYVQGQEPVVRTSFGAIIRYGFVMCKAWTSTNVCPPSG